MLCYRPTNSSYRLSMIRVIICWVDIGFPLSICWNLPKTFGTSYGSLPSTSGSNGVWPWTTNETLKWLIKSLVTAYGAPITTSSTYWNKNKIRCLINVSSTLISYATSENTENTFMNIHNWMITSFITIDNLITKIMKFNVNNKTMKSIYSIGM